MKRIVYNLGMSVIQCLIGAVILAGVRNPAEAAPLPSLSEIFAGMRNHEAVQDSRLVQYEAVRRFFAENRRFDLKSTLEVRTVFHRPGSMQSEIVRSDGSKLIREMVFDKILEAEREANSQAAREETKITPENYDFTLIGREDCDGRACYRLSIVPKKKNKFSIEGEIWLDAEDYAIVRLEGSPARRPSLWTKRTEIVREYKRVDGVWLCKHMESTSDIMIGGHSTLSVDYDYIHVDAAGLANR